MSEKIVSFIVYSVDVTLAFFKKQLILYKQQKALREILHSLKNVNKEAEKIEKEK